VDFAALHSVAIGTKLTYRNIYQLIRFWSGADKTRLSLRERRNPTRHSGNARSNLDRQLS